MTDPTTTEGRAELRAAAEAVGKRTRWNWDRIEGDFHVHESEWDVAEISCGSYDRSSDEERMNIERRIATFIAAADPETVCKLLDALDESECEVERLRGDLIIERRQGTAELRRAEKAEVALAEKAAVIGELISTREAAWVALSRVHADVDELENTPMVGASSEEQWEFDTRRIVAQELRAALEGES